MSSSDERLRALKGSQAELSPVLEAIEHALDDVSRLVEVCVVFELQLAVLSRRDARGCLGLVEPFAQVICIISPVGDDCAAFGHIWLKALTGLGNVGPVSCSQTQVKRSSGAVAHQMQLGIQSAFGLADRASVAVVF